MALPIVVVKVGTSSLLTAHDDPEMSVFRMIADDIAALASTYRIILVTSGAIGFGVRFMELSARPNSIEERQALSMIGQVGLLRRWREALEPLPIGQVLVTRHELTEHQTSSSFVRSVQALWRYGALPIVNENDAVATEEISFGDNDHLAAMVAQAVGAERLVYLTNQNGIQAAFGDSEQQRIKTATVAEARGHIVQGTSELGSGGAASKLDAAAVAIGHYIDVWIADARIRQPIRRALSGENGTHLVR